LLADPKMIPWPEYPRPQLVRGPSSWQCLNGAWDYAVREEVVTPATSPLCSDSQFGDP